MMAGLIYPTSGTVSIDGEILHKDIATPRSIGILIENPAFLPGYTGQRNLELLAGLTGKADRTQIAKTMSRVGLDPNDKRTYRKYSLGMKQRLGIACALMECPDLILLDEPINAIDEKGVPKIWEALQEEKQRGALIVLACHDTEELTSLADQIITIAALALAVAKPLVSPDGQAVMFFPAVFSSAFDKRLSLCAEKIFQTDGVCPVNLCLGIIHRDSSSFLCRVWGRFWSICSSVCSLNRAAVSTHDLTFQRRCKSSLTALNSP